MFREFETRFKKVFSSVGRDLLKIFVGIAEFSGKTKPMNNTAAANNLEVANEIRRQIGAAALFLMGAQNIGGTHNALSFKIRGSKKFTHITVTLDPNDTYTVTFQKIRGFNVTAKQEIEGIYCDGLLDCFERHTGLFCSVTPRR